MVKINDLAEEFGLYRTTIIWNVQRMNIPYEPVPDGSDDVQISDEDAARVRAEISHVLNRIKEREKKQSEQRTDHTAKENMSHRGHKHWHKSRQPNGHVRFIIADTEHPCRRKNRGTRGHELIPVSMIKKAYVDTRCDRNVIVLCAEDPYTGANGRYRTRMYYIDMGPKTGGHSDEQKVMGKLTSLRDSLNGGAFRDD